MDTIKNNFAKIPLRNITSTCQTLAWAKWWR